MTTATRMTAPEYHAVSVEGDRTQLVDGAVVVKEPKPIHSLLQERVLFALGSWIRAGVGRGLVIPPTSITMDDYNVYGPDIIWFSEAHIPENLREYPSRVPDLCVEIRSPGTWRYDVGTKKRVYEAGGLPELWLVDDVAETVLVFRRSNPEAPEFDVALELTGGDTLESPLLSRFALPVTELFAAA